MSLNHCVKAVSNPVVIMKSLTIGKEGELVRHETATKPLSLSADPPCLARILQHCPVPN